MRNIADTAKNIHIGYPMNPSHIANNLYGIGVTAVKTIISMPYLLNIGFIVVSINSGFENVFISQIPTESHNQAPIMYAIAPPTIDPSAAAIVIGSARFLSAIIGGVIKTSGGMNKNMDSHIVSMNTIHEYAGCSDFFNMYSANFILVPLGCARKNLLDCNLIFTTLQSLYKPQVIKMAKKQINSNRAGRVASKVQTLVAEILRDDFSDDKIISGVSLVGAVAHGGLQFVRLFYYSRDENIPVVQKRLDEITKTVRYELAARMNQKYVPDIRFEYDDTLDRAGRIDALLESLDTGDK